MNPQAPAHSPFILLLISLRLHSTGSALNIHHGGAIVRSTRLFDWLFIAGDSLPDHPSSILSPRWSQSLREFDRAGGLDERSMGSLSFSHLAGYSNEAPTPAFHAIVDSFFHAMPSPALFDAYASNDRRLFELIDPFALHLPKPEAELGPVELIGQLRPLTQAFENRLAMEQAIPDPHNPTPPRRL